MGYEADLSRAKVAEELEIQSGATMNIKGTWQINGTAVTATAAEVNAIAGGGLSAAELAVLDGVTAGTASASKAFVMDADKMFTIGALGSSGATGSAVAMTAAKTAVFRVYGEDGAADLGSAATLRTILGRSLISGNYTQQAEVFGVVGQCVVKQATVNHNTAGVMGSWEGNTTAPTITGTAWDNCHAGVIGRVGVPSGTSVSATGVLAAIAAKSNITSGNLTVTAGGIYAGVYVGQWAGTQAFGHGLFVDPASAGCGVSVGQFASSYATGSGLVFTSANTAAARFYGESTSDLTSAVNARTVVARHLIVTSSGTVNHETYGLIGQVCVKNTTLGHYHGGVMGTYESNTAATILTSYGVGGLVGRVGAESTTVNSGGLLAGVLAVENTTSWTNNGIIAGFATKVAAGKNVWPIGLYISAASATEGIRVGDFAASYATGSALVFSATNTAIGRFYGESTSDLTSAINARTVVARHLIVTSSGTVNHETYGLIGQVCVKNTTLAHLHSGLMGTFEVSTAATANSSYDYGAAGVIARLGVGTSILTATKPICGFAAIYNGGALVSGASAAFASCSTTATTFTYFLAAADCDYFFYAATGVNYENGAIISNMTALGGAVHTCSGLLKVKVASTDYYIPLYAAGEVTGEAGS